VREKVESRRKNKHAVKIETRIMEKLELCGVLQT
jgi:hypothetical protein